MKCLAAVVLCVVVVPSSAFGSPIVWEAFGTVTRTSNQFPWIQAPPAGTPWSVRLSFDPQLTAITAGARPGDGCSVTPAAGSFDLGGTAYSMNSSHGAFTNSWLPNSNCITGPGSSGPATGSVEFFMFPRPIDTDPWRLIESPYFMLFSYNDLIHRDGTFPSTPTYDHNGEMLFTNDLFQMQGHFAPQVVDVDPPAVVPEPGTLALVGIGLALGYGRRRAQDARKGIEHG